MSYLPPHAARIETLSSDTMNHRIQGLSKDLDSVCADTPLEELGNDTEIFSPFPSCSLRSTSASSTSTSTGATSSPLRKESGVFSRVDSSESLYMGDNPRGCEYPGDHGNCSDNLGNDGGGGREDSQDMEGRKSTAPGSSKDLDMPNFGSDALGLDEEDSLQRAGRETRFISRHTTARSAENDGLRRRRRAHSFHTGPRMRRLSCDYDSDTIFFRVELFLSGLERRLRWLEECRSFQVSPRQIDSGLKRAYAALVSVRDSCSSASDLMGSGKRRAKILVETLENRFDYALATKESLEQKAQAGVRIMESFLVDLETHMNVVRHRGLYATLDDGWHALDNGLAVAKGVVGEEMHRAREAVRESIETAMKLAQIKGLLTYSEIPHPWRINPHIIRGYRFVSTPRDCLISIFRPSNEMFNIWSHLIGLMIVASIAFFSYPLTANFSLSTKTDISISAVFFFCACKCLVCSAVWHTMNGISSQTTMERFACIDYTGISVLVAASIVTTEYTAFYCEPVSCWTYIILTAILGVAGSIMPWHPKFNGHDMAWVRVSFFAFLALTGFAPIVQLAYTRGLSWAVFFYAPIMKSMLVYISGAMVYASRIPERWWPGRFDYAGCSHNLWHLAVLGGILFHYHAMQELYAGAFVRRQMVCPASLDLHIGH